MVEGYIGTVGVVASDCPSHGVDRHGALLGQSLGCCHRCLGSETVIGRGGARGVGGGDGGQAGKVVVAVGDPSGGLSLPVRLGHGRKPSTTVVLPVGEYRLSTQPVGDTSHLGAGLVVEDQGLHAVGRPVPDIIGGIVWGQWMALRPTLGSACLCSVGIRGPRCDAESVVPERGKKTVGASQRVDVVVFVVGV